MYVDDNYVIWFHSKLDLGKFSNPDTKYMMQWY